MTSWPMDFQAQGMPLITASGAFEPFSALVQSSPFGRPKRGEKRPCAGQGASHKPERTQPFKNVPNYGAWFRLCFKIKLVSMHQGGRCHSNEWNHQLGWEISNQQLWLAYIYDTVHKNSVSWNIYVKQPHVAVIVGSYYMAHEGPLGFLMSTPLGRFRRRKGTWGFLSYLPEAWTCNIRVMMFVPTRQ